MKKPCLLKVLLASAALSLCACSSDAEEPQVDRQTAQLVVREVTRRVQIDLASYRGADDSGQVTFDCVNGGNVSVDGEVEVSSDPVMVDVNVAMEYASCMTKGGYGIDGGLTFSQEVVIGGDKAAFDVETLLTGTTTVFHDDEEYDCDFDLNVVVTSEGALVNVGGSACGHAANTFELTITPHW
ncbi:MAG: hypothetical protein OXR73_18285 [Myxococcales bacterium]|nr:hypothetical protein [Myxococcales bacterium]